MWTDGKETQKTIMELATMVRDGNISIQQIPIKDIANILLQVYTDTEVPSRDYLRKYLSLFEMALKSGDSEVVSCWLELVAFHALEIGRYNESIMESYTIVKEVRSQKGHLVNKIRNLGAESTKREYGYVPFMGKGVVYSAITGGYDEVKEPQYINPELDYIMFTDNPNVKSVHWDVRLVDNPDGLDSTRLARRIKILGHEYLKGYDYSIWVDGKLEIMADLLEYVHLYRENESILCFPHFYSDCIYIEQETCRAMSLDNEETMRLQMERYREEGYPAHNGMIDSGFLVREIEDEDVKRLMSTWWNEVYNGSKRDQLSFNYCCWKEHVLYDTSDLHIYGNKYVRLHKHN